MSNKQDFGTLLANALQTIKDCEGINIGDLEKELGKALGKSSAIEYWKAGNTPASPNDLEQLARLLIGRQCKQLDRAWLFEFLTSASYRDPDALCDELFPRPRIRGTTPPIFIPKCEPPKYIMLHKAYFLVKLTNVEVVYQGDMWTMVDQFSVNSKVALNCPPLSPIPIEVWHGTYTVKNGQMERLSFATLLPDVVPAKMSQMSVALTFAGEKMSHPIFQFAGNFLIWIHPRNDGLRAGYYAMLGSQDGQHPLSEMPDPSRFKVKENRLYWDEQPVSQLGYSSILLEVMSLDTRTHFMHHGAPWHLEFMEAKALAEDVAKGMIAGEKRIEAAWETCYGRLKQARTLLYQDPWYLPDEAELIYMQMATSCRDKFLGITQAERSLKSYRGQPEAAPELQADLADLELDPYTNVAAALLRYAEQVDQTRSLLRQEGML